MSVNIFPTFGKCLSYFQWNCPTQYFVQIKKEEYLTRFYSLSIIDDKLFFRWLNENVTKIFYEYLFHPILSLTCNEKKMSILLFGIINTKLSYFGHNYSDHGIWCFKLLVMTWSSDIRVIPLHKSDVFSFNCSSVSWTLNHFLFWMSSIL